MTTVAAMRKYLRDVIGIGDVDGPNPAARRAAIQAEGLSVLDDFLEFDDASIKTLCSSVRKPSGLVTDPNDPNRLIVDPGFNIPAICEKRLKWAAYAARSYQMVGRVLSQDGLNRARLKLFERHAELVKDHVDPEKLPVVTKTYGIMKAMDVLPNHLREHLGSRKIPISYVIRDNDNPPALENLAPNKVTGASYDSIMDELIAYVPLTGDHYIEDNAKVFQIIQDMVAGTTFESSIKSHQRNRDGRNAYFALCQHNLGSSKWEKIIEDGETYVMKREWNGKNYMFSLKNHISKHQEAHNEMVRASQFIDFEVPNEYTRVGRLLKSITCKEPAVISAITHIQGNNGQRSDFELAADFLILTAPKVKNNTSGSQRISSIKSQQSKQGKKKGKSGVELRYYTKNEYRSLTKDQKKELAEWRKKEKEGDPDHRVAVLQQQVDEMRSQTESLRATIAALSTRQQPEPTRDPLINSLTQRSN